MKKQTQWVLAVMMAAAFPFLACTADKVEDKPLELKTSQDKISYVLGREVGQGLGGLPSKIDLNVFMRGLRDSLDQRSSLLTPEQEEQAKADFTAQMKEEESKKWAATAEQNQKAEEDFLAKNKPQEGVVTTPSGLQYQVVKDGSGAGIKESDKVKVHYRGTLIDGTEFDSSYARNQPAVFTVSGVIPGWTEGLQLMKIGGKYRLWIPSKLAYGARGAGQSIGPNTLLIFEVEPLEIAN
jgi:FKBP-type peptidyl-prolyl cis-trans isomerase